MTIQYDVPTSRKRFVPLRQYNVLSLVGTVMISVSLVCFLKQEDSLLDLLEDLLEDS